MQNNWQRRDKDGQMRVFGKKKLFRYMVDSKIILTFVVGKKPMNLACKNLFS